MQKWRETLAYLSLVEGTSGGLGLLAPPKAKDVGEPLLLPACAWCSKDGGQAMPALFQMSGVFFLQNNDPVYLKLTLLESEIRRVITMASGRKVSFIGERGTYTYNTTISGHIFASPLSLCNCRKVQVFLLLLRETQSGVYVGWFMGVYWNIQQGSCSVS